MSVNSLNDSDCGLLSIDLAALADNYDYLSDFAKGSVCGCVIKADAYGLGVRQVMSCVGKGGLSRNICSDFFVATLAEAIEARSYNDSCRIFVLNGLYRGEFERYIDYDLRPVLKSLEDVETWLDCCENRRISMPAALHLETGINRLGILATQLAALDMERLRRVIPQLMVMSHLASGFCANQAKNLQQLSIFRRFADVFDEERLSFCNSAGLLLGKDYHYDLIRLGLILYGINPHDEAHEIQKNLKTVVRLHSPLAQIRTLSAGETVGYGASWQSQSDIVTGIILLGYADGLPFSASNRAILSIDGYPAPVIGRISMDITVISLQQVPQHLRKIGANVEIFGDHVSIESFSKICYSHPHEILVRLGSRFIRHFSQ